MQNYEYLVPASGKTEKNKRVLNLPPGHGRRSDELQAIFKRYTDDG